MALAHMLKVGLVAIDEQVRGACVQEGAREGDSGSLCCDTGKIRKIACAATRRRSLFGDWGQRGGGVGARVVAGPDFIPGGEYKASWWALVSDQR